MKKKKLIRGSILIIVLLSIFIVYRFYLMKPSEFLTNDQIVKEINNVFPEAVAQTVQDKLPLDDRHMLVPFISSNGTYSLSHWLWKHGQWKVAVISSKGYPRVWKIDENDPSTFFFVWNMHPTDNVAAIDFYLLKDRGYRISDDIHQYDPKVQMKTTVSLQEKSYGVMRIPADWVAFWDEYKRVQQPDSYSFLSQFDNDPSIYFGWLPTDEKDNEIYPEHSVNGHTFNIGQINIDHIMILNKRELE